MRRAYYSVAWWFGAPTFPVIFLGRPGRSGSRLETGAPSPSRALCFGVPAKLNTTALVAFAAAVLGFTCLWGVGGLLAVVLGCLSLKEIERSAGRESGRNLSIAAVALGGLNIAALVIGLGVGIAFLARPTHDPLPPPPPVALRPPTPRTFGPSELPQFAEPDSSAQNGGIPVMPSRSPQVTAFGTVRVVDVGDSGLLSRVLENQRREAQGAGEKLVIFVVGPDCGPCNDFSTALKDQRMQRALDRVRLVRVDASERAEELSDLGVPVDSVPGFALLGPSLRPVDYVHGGEWDADVPENIAPVLGAFVRGKYARRRHPFSRPQRPDEVTL